MKATLCATATIAAVAVLSGCASGVSANRQLTNALATKTIADSAGLSKVQTHKAQAKLDSAIKLKQDENEQQALYMAEQSALEYRLALAVAERDSVKKEDARIETELKNDEKRKLLYQNILNSEIKK